MTYDLCIDIEALADGDDLFCNLWAYIDFHAMTHVEYLVHLLPVGARTVVDSLEEWWYWEHVVLHYLAVFAYEVEHLGLCTACAVYHTVDFWAQFVEQFFDDWGVCAGRREHELACIDRSTFHLIGQFVFSAVNQFAWYCVVEAFWVFLCEILSENIVAGRGESVAAHTAVVLLLVCSLTSRGKTYDNVARTDVGIVDDIAALHAASYGRIHDDGAYEVAYVSSFATSRVDADAHFSHFVEEFISTVDDSRDDVSRNEHLVSSDSR